MSEHTSNLKVVAATAVIGFVTQLFTHAASSCSSVLEPSPKPAPTVPMPDNPEDACAKAEANLTAKNCKEAHPKGGGSFKDFCVRKLKAGVNINPECLSRVSCEDIEKECNK